ncbi:tetratricopeptide repeat protein [Sinomonas halotolerans]|uniref:Tetratricopeptide repeat protein n=1 Tax=Sinomonas halotolerans TaxID=1644133 RepID=A0ABU9WZN6_9MICC
MNEPPAARSRRLRRRRVLLAWGAVPSLAALAVAAKLLLMTGLAQQAIWAFDAEDGPGVSLAADGMGFADVVETHKSWFARGDAHVLAGEHEQARAAFEEALRRTDADDECTVRVNLVLAIEELGDSARAAGDAVGAERLFGEGSAVVDDAPEGCFEPQSPQNQQGQGERLEEAGERLEGKSGAGDAAPAPSGGQNGQEPSQEPSPRPGQDAPATGEAAPREGTAGESDEERARRELLEQLERKSDAGEQERAEGEQMRDYLDSPPDAPVERPW